MENNTITITAFKAVERPDLCAQYAMEHGAVLHEFGVSDVVKPNVEWMHAADSIVLVAQHDELGMVGGIRIQHRHPHAPLPMELASGSLRAQLSSLMDKYSSEPSGEICGLWNAHRFAGKGLPLILSMAAVSLANQVGLRSLFCFVAHYTLRHALKVGFQIVEDFGDGGAITYPIPRIKSFAMVIPDTILLDLAPDHYRSRILSLRCRPVQECIEAPTGTPVGVRYKLRIDDDTEIQAFYAEILRQYQKLRA